MRHLWAIVLILAATLSALFGANGVAVAQSSDSQQRPESSEDGPPPGACNPIGITTSGEIVFPMTCRDFIEKHKAADREASAAESKQAATDKPAAVDADRASTTGDATKAAEGKAADAADASKAPAAVDAGKAPTAAVSSGKPDEKDAKPAAAQAATNEPAKEAAKDAARPVTRQAAVAPAETTSSNVAAEPATTAALPKQRPRARVGAAGAPGCTRFRSYDAASATYRDFGGQRRSCP